MASLANHPVSATDNKPIIIQTHIAIPMAVDGASVMTRALLQPRVVQSAAQPFLGHR
jgi:hypothetical protein